MANSHLCAGPIGVALLVVASVARAAPFACETRTKRAPGEIVVPLGDRDLPRLPPQAIRIVPGEQLCITGTRDANGDLMSLRLVGNARGAGGPVVRLRMSRGSDSELEIAHSSDSWLFYNALRLVTQQDVALPTTTLPVPPHVSGVEQWDRATRKLLLYGFSFGRPPPALRRSDRNERDPGVLNLSATFGFWAGEHWARLDALSRALVQDGFAPLPRVARTGGLDLDFTIGRVRGGVTFGAEGRTTRHLRTGAELSTWLTVIGFTGGYDVLRYEQFHLFASTGILFGDLRVDDRTPGLTLFRDVKPWEPDRVKAAYAALPLDVGFDYFVPLGHVSPTERWVVQIGARLGWIQQLGEPGWTTDEERDARDLVGPPVDVSGARGRVVLGIGAQNGW